jgi:glycosyltransferase involved in cell wall biosynthesis
VRICFVSEGISIHTQRWVNYFAKKGHDVHLICWRVLPGYDKNVHIHLLTRFPPKTWNLSLYPSALFWIMQVRQLIKEIKPDVVVGFYLTGMGYISARSGFQPVVVVGIGSDILIEPKRNLLWKFHARYAIRKADLIVCLAPILEEEISRLGVDPNKVRTILIGVDTEKFQPLPGDKKLRYSLGIGMSQPIVISTRSLYPIYNVGTLIKSIPLILKEIPEAKFIIAGKGKQQGHLEKLAQELGVSSSVRFIGWVAHDRLPEYLALADVYVSTSLSDGASNSLLEAMACGIVPVVTDIPANRGWVTDGENGFVVPPGDTAALAERIVYLIKNKEIRETFGKIGREIVKQRAEYAREMEKMEMIYQGLLTDKKESS